MDDELGSPYEDEQHINAPSQPPGDDNYYDPEDGWTHYSDPETEERCAGLDPINCTAKEINDDIIGAWF